MNKFFLFFKFRKRRLLLVCVGLVLAGLASLVAIFYPHAFHPTYWKPYWTWITTEACVVPGKRVSFTLKTEEAEEKIRPLVDAGIFEEGWFARIYDNPNWPDGKSYCTVNFEDLFRYVDGDDVDWLVITIYYEDRVDYDFHLLEEAFRDGNLLEQPKATPVPAPHYPLASPTSTPSPPPDLV